MTIFRLLGNPNESYQTGGLSYVADSQGIVTVDDSAIGFSTDLSELKSLGLTISGSASGAPQFHNRQISATGVTPGATGADNVIAVYSLPGDSFGASGRGITIIAAGSFAATGNNKRVKLWWNPATAVVGSTIGAGGTLLADTGTVATNNGGWWLSGSVFKYGALGSNTQLCVSSGAIAGAVSAGLVIPALATAAESSAILIAVTGNATTAATDIVFNWLDVNSEAIDS